MAGRGSSWRGGYSGGGSIRGGGAGGGGKAKGKVQEVLAKVLVGATWTILIVEVATGVVALTLSNHALHLTLASDPLLLTSFHLFLI